MHNFNVRDLASVYDLQSGSAKDSRLNLLPQVMPTAIYMVSLSPSECQHMSSNQAMNIWFHILFNLSSCHLWAAPWLRQFPASHRGDPGSIPDQSMWYNWRTTWYWGRFSYENFSFPLLVSFHQCSILNHSPSINTICTLGNWKHIHHKWKRHKF
jgi:hypothetical protein